ncbi:hypothetical protein KSS87_015626 [Heliosperma pusillum]|nr:hypothetical protein KSS87_015626 [Heliosperma pusillum]
MVRHYFHQSLTSLLNRCSACGSPPVISLGLSAEHGYLIKGNCICDLVWHYQDCSHDFRDNQSNEPNNGKRGKHIVAVKPQGLSKGSAVEKLIATMRNEGTAPDFVLCIGDDRSDEDMCETSNTLSTANLEIFACAVG